MKERPILFSAPMVRAVLAGTKTQTRRVCKPAEAASLSSVVEVPDPAERGQVYNGSTFGDEDGEVQFSCPYGQPGDKLWVQEEFCKIIGQSGGWIETDYRATYTHGFRLGDSLGIRKKWTPSIHMPRDASRITLEITGVRVERLQDISEADARAEGVTDGGCLNCGESEPCGCPAPAPDARDAFVRLWMSINGSESWLANPWVWVLEFCRINSKEIEHAAE